MKKRSGTLPRREKHWRLRRLKRWANRGLTISLALVVILMVILGKSAFDSIATEGADSFPPYVAWAMTAGFVVVLPLVWLSLAGDNHVRKEEKRLGVQKSSPTQSDD